MMFNEKLIMTMVGVGGVVLGWTLRSLSHLQDARTTHAFFGLEQPALRVKKSQDVDEQADDIIE